MTSSLELFHSSVHNTLSCESKFFLQDFQRCRGTERGLFVSTPKQLPRGLHFYTGQAFTFQMSDAYSAIVRSLENFPEPATFRIALRVHPSRSA